MESRPARGGRIEILGRIICGSTTLSRPARGGLIEMTETNTKTCSSMSRPARGGWIEIRSKFRVRFQDFVPLRMGQSIEML